MKVDKSKLTHMGSMNYILQAWQSEDDPGIFHVDQYQPRRNRVWNGDMSREEVIPQIEETIERMKIAIELMQELLDGKRTYVYYWEFDEE